MTYQHKPQAWKTVPLGTLAEFRNGVNFTKASFGSGIKVINVKDFQDRFKPSYEELGEINPVGIVRENDLLKEDDILFVRSNGNRQLIGRSLLIKGASEPVTHSAFTIRARFQSREAFPLFYAYALRSHIVRDALSAFGSGTNINNLNQGILSNLPVPLPPLASQHAIGGVLSEYDELIENNTRRIKILEEMAQSLYREWFVHFRFPGHEKAKFVHSLTGIIPEGWVMRSVNDFVSIKSGFAFKSSKFRSDGYYGLITIKNVQDGTFVQECHSRISELPPRIPDYCHVKTGDILLSLTGNIGRVCLAYGQNYVLNQRVAKLVPAAPNYRAFTYFTFRQSEFQNRLQTIANGVAQQNLSPIETGLLKLALPQGAIMEKFAEFGEPLLDQMLSLSSKTANLRCTRDLLLPKLVSGAVFLEGLRISER